MCLSPFLKMGTTHASLQSWGTPFPSMTNINITEHGVYKLLKNQKPHKATGPDEVPAFILRFAAQQLAP
jgi:sulfur relay (sulfurtransferase) DsrF/TusC family protein